MKSTLRHDIRPVKGGFSFEPKEYPDWHGIPDIGFIWINSWADPMIEYKGKEYNSHDVEDTMWDWFYEETCGDPNEFSQFMRDNVNEVYRLLEELQ